MSQSKDRPKVEKNDVGKEVVDGLEHTLAWMKVQFDGMRADVNGEKAKTALASDNY